MGDTRTALRTLGVVDEAVTPEKREALAPQVQGVPPHRIARPPALKRIGRKHDESPSLAAEGRGSLWCRGLLTGPMTPERRHPHTPSRENSDPLLH